MFTLPVSYILVTRFPIHTHTCTVLSQYRAEVTHPSSVAPYLLSLLLLMTTHDNGAVAKALDCWFPCSCDCSVTAAACVPATSSATRTNMDTIDKNNKKEPVTPELGHMLRLLYNLILRANTSPTSRSTRLLLSTPDSANTERMQRCVSSCRSP